MGEGVYTAHVNANVLLMSETFWGGGGAQGRLTLKISEAALIKLPGLIEADQTVRPPLNDCFSVA